MLALGVQAANKTTVASPSACRPLEDRSLQRQFLNLPKGKKGQIWWGERLASGLEPSMAPWRRQLAKPREAVRHSDMFRSAVRKKKHTAGTPRSNGTASGSRQGLFSRVRNHNVLHDLLHLQVLHPLQSGARTGGDKKIGEIC